MMICQWPDGCDNYCEGNTNYCGTHNYQLRKSMRISMKEPKKKAPLKKYGENTFLCSNGIRVKQIFIDHKRSESYKLIYPQQTMMCVGCGINQAHGSAHIISQSRLKKLGLTELIWNPELFFPGCIICNSVIENPKGDAWRKLLNIEECLRVIEKYDPELHYKFVGD